MQRPSSRYFAYALIMMLVGSVFSMTMPALQPSYASHENITVNIGIDDVTESYDPGDSVAIEGVIENVEENEDVTIRIREPSGSLEDTDSQEPGSGGVFDHLFVVPNNADEGVWTVEVEYDGDEVFTYFIVDDENDTILVIVDEESGIYEAGSEVTISGSVDEADDAEENVMITVLDPANDEIVNEVEVELDGDEFEHDFTLDNDAGHGRYAVIVTYDIDGQEGSILFEIEDDDAGSGGEVDVCSGGSDDSDGDLTAELEEDTYAPGDTVCVSGIIEDYDDSEELGIVIEDPEGVEIEEDDDVTVNEDGSDGVFEFEYDLEDDAAGGDYTVIITYANDEVELTFEVEAEEDEEGEGVSESGDLTVRLDKRSYLAGTTMTVSGEVDDVEDEELLSVLLYRPTGQVVLEASKHTEPDSDGEYSVDLVIPSHLEPDEDYAIMASYINDEAEITFDITGVSEIPEDEITIETDEDEYEIGSTVEISGDIPDSLIVEGQRAFIEVIKPGGNPCRLDQFNIPASGSYEYELVLGGECGIAGEYEVTMTYRQQEAEITFELIGSSVSEYDLEVDDETYEIEYELSDGSINSMFVRPDDDKLVISIDAEEDGQLTVVLPREVIDAVGDGEDIQYVVTITDIETGEVTVVEVEESENTDEARTIVIDFEGGADLVEIVGTQVVPEFGAIAAIVLAVSIFGIIAATARFSNRFNVFGQ